MVAQLPPLSQDLLEEYLQIPLSDGTQARAKMWRRKDFSSSAPPLILLFHGGGFHAGSCEQCTRPGREFALEFHAVVISAEYRLAPEHKFPQMQLDGLDLAGWLFENASTRFGADVDKGFVGGGSSAGANVAAVVAWKARERGIRVTGSYLCIPFLFSEASVLLRYADQWTSHRENTTEKALRHVNVNAILQSMQADTTSPLFCPTNSPDTIQDLPRTYAQVGGKDIWRDDGIVYEHILKDRGIDTRLDVYQGLSHQTWSVWPYEDVEMAERLRGRSMAAMRWLLDR